jgi:hypothetical protein
MRVNTLLAKMQWPPTSMSTMIPFWSWELLAVVYVVKQLENYVCCAIPSTNNTKSLETAEIS